MKAWRWDLTLLLWTTVLGLSLALVAPAAAASLRVVQDPADVRSGPGLLYAVKAEAGRGTVWAQTGRQGDWYRVRLADGTPGWLDGPAVTTFPGPGTPAKVTWPDAVLYEGPGTGFPVAGWLRRGDALTVWGQSGAWALASASDGAAGWLPAALLAGEPGPGRSLPEALAVTTTALNVRGGPSAGARLLTTVSRDEILVPRGRLGDWFQVLTPDGILGWVDGQFTGPAVLPMDGDLLAGVAQRHVDLFAGPGTGFPVTAGAGRGAYFTVLAKNGAWLKVKLAGGEEGWLPAAVLDQDPGGAPPEGGVIAGKGVWYEGVDHITDTTDFAGRTFRDAGVTHVYLEAGTSKDGFPAAWQRQLDILLPAAHRLGIKVIVWVYVQLRDIAGDAALTGRVANYVTPDGERPDGVAADIEELPANHQAARELTAGYASLTRRLLPPGLPLIAVTYAPQFEGNYPFDVMAADFDAVVLMDYWHTTVNDYGAGGAAALVRNSLVLLRAKAGRPVPVEVILQGFTGPAGLPDRREMLGALTAARAAGGYSVYTWRSMNGVLRDTFARFR